MNPSPADSSTNGRAVLSGDPLILVVDDELIVREITQFMIQDHGGRAATFESAEEALTFAAQQRGNISCAIVDFSMPGMNGLECVNQLRLLQPKLPVVMISGLSLTPEVRALKDRGEIEFLAKPFREAELLERLAKCLSQKAPPFSFGPS